MRCLATRQRRAIVQCFPSIDHAILRGILARAIADKDVLWLIDQILASGARVHERDYVMRWFDGDDPST